MTAPALIDERCPSCGGVITLEFCDVCGEKRPSLRAYTVAEFIHEIFEVFTNVERSFLRTVWTLVRRPGELTAAYMRGERVHYLRPFQLFLLLNLVFFFIGGGAVTMFSTPLETHLNATPYKERARAVVADWRPATGLTMPEYQKAFDKRALVLARTLVIVLAPAFAVGIAIISVNRSQSLVKASVFSFHAIGVIMLQTIVVAWVTIGILKALHAMGVHGERMFDDLATSLLAMAFIAYMYVALRRAYGDGRIGALAKAGVSFLMFMFLLIHGYRPLLFYVTVYTL